MNMNLIFDRFFRSKIMFLTPKRMILAQCVKIETYKKDKVEEAKDIFSASCATIRDHFGVEIDEHKLSSNRRASLFLRRCSSMIQKKWGKRSRFCRKGTLIFLSQFLAFSRWFFRWCRPLEDGWSLSSPSGTLRIIQPQLNDQRRFQKSLAARIWKKAEQKMV